MGAGLFFIAVATLLALTGFAEGTDAGLRSLGILAIGCLCGAVIGTVAAYLSSK